MSSSINRSANISVPLSSVCATAQKTPKPKCSVSLKDPPQIHLSNEKERQVRQKVGEFVKRSFYCEDGKMISEAWKAYLEWACQDVK